MLIEFSVENFRSFRKRATLSMVAESNENDSTTVLMDNGDRLLPLTGIFGPNAGGKSNFVKAISFATFSITNPNSLTFPSYNNPIFKPFALDVTNAKKASSFEMLLWDQKKRAEYKYSFEIGYSGIEYEMLEVSRKASSKMATSLVFERSKNGFKFGSSVSSKKLKKFETNVLPSAHAVNVFAQVANEHSASFVKMVQNIWILDGHQNMTGLHLEKLRTDDVFKSRVLELLKASDISIVDFIVDKQIPTQSNPVFKVEILDDKGEPVRQQMYEYRITTIHKFKTKDGYRTAMFDYANEESTGTQMLFGYLTMMLTALESGTTVIVDEFGTSLHPLLIGGILDLFKDKEANKTGAQLVFVTHETHVLGDKISLRRDEVWFVSKDETESSELFSLTEFRTRTDLNVEKNYLKGRFGAVPVTGTRKQDELS